MTGSLQIKNDKYYVVLNTYDKNRKRKLKWIPTGLPQKGNKKRAEQFLRQCLNEYETNQCLAHDNTLFSDAVRLWLKETEMRVDCVTLQGYRQLADSHILPYFDSMAIKLIDVDRRILQDYINEKFESGRLDGKGGLSPRSLRLHKNILYQTLDAAFRDDLIPRNPCKNIILPQTQRYESSFYNVEQIQQLLRIAESEHLYPLIKLTVVYGLRRSEVLGLKWDSVDFNANTLSIKHTVTRVTKAVEKDKTKNASSYRSFPQMPDIKDLLLTLKGKEKENRKLFGKSYFESDYILKWDDGRPFSPDYVTHRFSRILEINDLPHIRFHELRHSCASFLIQMGFTLKDVQEWLGHADIKMTANIYSHLDISRKRNMADMLSQSILK